MLRYATPPLLPSLTHTRSASATSSAAPPAESSALQPGSGPQIALAICEVEAGLRSPLQLEELCHWTLWPKLSALLRRSGGPAVPVGSLVRVIAQEHTPGLAEVTVLIRRGGRVVPGSDAAGRGQGPLEASRAPILTTGWRLARAAQGRPAPDLRIPPAWPGVMHSLESGVVAAAGLAIVRP